MFMESCRSDAPNTRKFQIGLLLYLVAILLLVIGVGDSCYGDECLRLLTMKGTSLTMWIFVLVALAQTNWPRRKLYIGILGSVVALVIYGPFLGRWPGVTGEMFLSCMLCLLGLLLACRIALARRREISSVSPSVPVHDFCEDQEASKKR